MGVTQILYLVLVQDWFRTSSELGQGLAASSRMAGTKSAASFIPVVLPNGSKVSDSHTLAGTLMSPVSDPSPVADAGNKTLLIYTALMVTNPTGADAYLAASLGSNVGTGGTFDYQRSGNFITGFTQLPQFRDVSNFNVGLFSAKAGLSLEKTLTITGNYARSFSSNADSKQPYGLSPRTAEIVRIGYNSAANFH
jgi:hypothetical protein